MRRLAVLLTGGIVVLWISRTALGQIKPEDRPELLDGFVEAANRLNQPACSALFRPDSRETLHSARYIVISFGKPVLTANGKFNVVSASVDRERNVIMINSDGPYMNPRLVVHGRHFNFGLKDREFRAALLLHELGHLTGDFQHDGKDPALSAAYTGRVLEACFPGVLR